MFKSFCQADLSTVTTADKRIMLKELKESKNIENLNLVILKFRNLKVMFV